MFFAFEQANHTNMSCQGRYWVSAPRTHKILDVMQRRRPHQERKILDVMQCRQSVNIPFHIVDFVHFITIYGQSMFKCLNSDKILQENNILNK